MPTFKFGEMSCTVENEGPRPQPWDRGETAYQYRVTVRHGHVRYTSPAWGSIADYRRGKKDPRSMAAMVLDELLSAACDPNEFVQMVMGEETGRKALALGKRAERTVRTAKKFPLATLEAAVEEAREEGLL